MAKATTTPDLAEFIAEKRSNYTKCNMCVLVGPTSPLSAVKKNQLRAAMDSSPEDIPSSAISRVLKAWGHPSNSQNIRRHRSEHRGK